MDHKGTQRIETDRIILRRYEMTDAKNLYKNWACDPDVTKYLTWQPHASVDVTEGLLAEWIEHYQDPKTYHWTIELKELGEPIGDISVVHIGENAGVCEVGYCLGKKWWGRGIMPEALGEVIAYLLDECDANKVAARHAPENPKSGRVMQKAGMQYEGTLRKNAKCNIGITDDVCYGILK